MGRRVKMKRREASGELEVTWRGGQGKEGRKERGSRRLNMLHRTKKLTDMLRNNGKVKNVKFSHTRYRALGPELIPVYRQSTRR